MFAMKICAPNISSGCAASNAMTRPISRLMSETIGSALTPAFSKTTPTSRQRIARGRRRPPRSPGARRRGRPAAPAASASIGHGRGADLARGSDRRGGRLPDGRERLSGAGKAESSVWNSGRRPRTVARTPGTSRPSRELVEQRHPRHVAPIDAAGVHVEAGPGGLRAGASRRRGGPRPPSTNVERTAERQQGLARRGRGRARRASPFPRSPRPPHFVPPPERLAICSDTSRPMRIAG